VCGVTLEEYSFIGAGSVITKNVPAYALMVGVPARRVGWMCQCGERLADNNPGACKTCGTKYKQEGDQLRRVS
jgi:UDP-2-acetamido-3-amino-2,3-dideoxy-glucuronate N-acetyltransferase